MLLSKYLLLTGPIISGNTEMASSTINDIQEENENGDNNRQPLLANDYDDVEYIMDCDIDNHIGSTTTTSDFGNNQTQEEFLLRQEGLISQDVKGVNMETNPSTMEYSSQDIDAGISNTVQVNQINVQDNNWSIPKGKYSIFYV